MQVLATHVHPAPTIDTKLKPDGTVSVTVTVALVAPAPAALLTVTVYAPACPCVKFPVCILLIFSTGRAMMLVESVALAVADPPPDTLTLFTCGEVALAATFKVAVIAA